MAKLRIQKLDIPRKSVDLDITSEFQSPSDHQLLYQTVENFLKIKDIQVRLNLEDVTRPTNSFIALLIELASMLERNGGQLVLTNVSTETMAYFTSFSPLSVLKLEEGASGSQVGRQPAQQSGTEGKADRVSSPAFEGLPNQGTTDIGVKNSSQAAEFEIADMIVDSPAPPKSPKIERIVVHSKEDQLYRLTDFVAVQAQMAGFSPTEISRIKISVYEAAHNIIEHAYQFDDSKFIEMNVRFDEESFVIQLIDKGRSFHYDPNKNYDAIEAAEERKTGGFGLHIIRRSMDEVKYETNPVWGNRLTMVKRLA